VCVCVYALAVAYTVVTEVNDCMFSADGLVTSY